MDTLSIRVPYKNLKHDADAAGVEMVKFEEEALRRIESDKSNIFPNVNASSSSSPSAKNCSLITLILSCTVAAGVQFGWALQLSLLTPYISEVSHCYVTKELSFHVVDVPMPALASFDIGYLIGDTKEHCSTFKGARPRAAFVFILGFWMLDLANNTVQASPDQRNSANAIFCTWMAIGNILGFSSGSSGKWHSWFPFLTSRACCEACGNLKAAFLVAVVSFTETTSYLTSDTICKVFLTFCTMVTLYFAEEVPLAPKQHLRLSDVDPLLEDPQSQQHGLDHTEPKPRKNAVDHKVGNMPENVFEMDTNERKADFTVKEDQVESFSHSPSAVLVNLLTSLCHLPLGMHSVLIVMALTWVSSNIYWMGREVFHGDPKGNAAEIRAYDEGVREGAFGLLLNSVVLGISSFFIEPMCQWIGSKFVWAVSNFIVFACGRPSPSVTYSVPFSVTADLTADTGGGQGLAIGVLILAIVIPQMIVSLGAGPWDALFGGGNVPAFVLASLSALSAGIIATLKLPTPSNSYTPIVLKETEIQLLVSHNNHLHDLEIDTGFGKVNSMNPKLK
ncbi:hypothetical protein L1987_16753 [Smallanthus sonchifolius]|uniref:Uncharacterized protein n=1 Tax=Smallanthus sonchifolius TaxID=185202 RepID=A0ACB9IX04_9ASTR|nr:hypothetical protein L1987_16753 [Smallanthus sonchifolius]